MMTFPLLLASFLAVAAAGVLNLADVPQDTVGGALFVFAILLIAAGVFAVLEYLVPAIKHTLKRWREDPRAVCPHCGRTLP